MTAGNLRDSVCFVLRKQGDDRFDAQCEWRGFVSYHRLMQWIFERELQGSHADARRPLCVGSASPDSGKTEAVSPDLYDRNAFHCCRSDRRGKQG